MRFNFFSAGNAVWRTLLALMLLTSPRCAQITQPSEGATGRAASLCRFGRKIFFRNHGGSALIRKFRDFRIAVGAWAQRLELAACVHFVDHGHLRTYALFIQNNAVIDARYAVQVDSCGSQSYTPFDVVTGMLGRPTAPRQPALY